MFPHLAICDCILRNNSNDEKCILFKKEDFCTPQGIISLKNNYSLANVLNSKLCRMNSNVSSGKNREFDCQVRFGVLLR